MWPVQARSVHGSDVLSDVSRCITGTNVERNWMAGSADATTPSSCLGAKRHAEYTGALLTPVGRVGQRII